jgi:hypothetical protein
VIYELARCIRSPGHPLWPNLHELKYVLPPDAYALGHLPPPVPLWALRRID